MNTLELLQKHLTTEVKETCPGITHKDLAPTLKCKDGTLLSVQASKYHYSTPCEDVGPYTEVEVWCITPNTKVTEFEYSESDPSAYVPIEQVAQFINNHGGMV